MARIGDFASAPDPIGPDTPGADVFDRFQREPDTLVIAVVDADRRPVGLIERNTFTLRMAAEFGRALYAKRPAATFMDAAPRVLDADADADILFQSMDAANLGALLNGFVVTSNGRYVGVCAGVHVLQAGSAIHRRRAEEMGALARDLARAEAEARASSRAKSEFLAVMSHEIRTPLNGVLGVAALMERELTQKAMKPYVRTILDSGQSLLRLLTDALDMSRAEAGQMGLEPAPVHLDTVVADLLALWSPRAQEKALALTVLHETDGPDWVLADEMRLKQLLNNLIGNALKFTPSGGVSVVLSSRWQDGDIGVERSPRGGARFQFTLCLPGAGPEALAASARAAEPTPHETLHILVVDDNATNRFVAERVLTLFGCTSDTAENGLEAVQKVQSRPYDLVLMDIKMPVMDGVEATRAIRALAGPVGQIPVLALTANADPRDEIEYLAAGMDGVSQKPIQPDALLNAIRLVFSDVAARSEVSQAA